MDFFRRRTVKKRPEPTTEDVVHIFSEWFDEFGIRRAITVEKCPVCKESLRKNVLFPPPKYRDLDPVDMICCLSCGSRFRIINIEKDGLLI